MSELLRQDIKGYEVTELLGEGGFGAVYRAFQPLVKREVAMKVILPQFANQPDFVRRFESEAQLVARLEHLHIVPLYDYWRDPSGAYLVMRLLRGGSLEEYIQAKGPLPLEDVMRWVEQIGSALNVAHQNGVIHRDLKPANILLDDLGNAFLSDFGIAKDVGETDAGAMVGTPAYVAPEQIQGLKVSPQTDIYNLGLMLYEMLAGMPAFQAKNASAMILQQMADPVPDITLQRPDLPRGINNVIQIATAKDANNRFQTCSGLTAALRQAIEGRKKRDTGSGLFNAVDEKNSTRSIEALITFPDDFEPFRISTTMLDLEVDAAELVNPYKGLRAFQETDAEDFFGREELTEKLLARLQEEEHRGKRFLAVVGPSGSGKSSVVKAGVIPALRRGALPGSENYFVAEMVPSTDAIRELEGALLSIAINPPDDIQQQLRSHTDALHHIIWEILPNDGSEFFLLIDQFEEVFTQTEDNAIRTHFMDMLQYAVSAPDSRFRVVITIRADFFDKPLMYAEFGALVRERFEVVLPLNREELERTIAGPAERAGARIEAELIERIVDEVVAEPGALPLLQYALTELFERRTGRTITLKSYQESGGVLASLAKRAEEIYVEMDSVHQEAIRQLFLRLVTLGEGTEDTRRRILWSELVFQQEENDPLQKVLDTYGKYRLLTFDKDPQTREPTVEVAHEALIRQWKRLRDWLRNSREDLRAQRRLASSVMEWRNSGGDKSFLAAGSRLQQFETLLVSENIALTKDERDYISHSVEKREAEERAELERLEREKQLEERNRRNLRRLVAVMTIAAILSAGLAVFAFFQQAEAESQRQEADRQRVVADEARVDAETQAEIAQRRAEENYSLNLANQAAQISRIGDDAFQSLALVMEANRIANVPAESQRSLGSVIFQPGVVRSLRGHSSPLRRAVYSPDSSMIAAGGDNGFVILYDAHTGQIIRNMGTPSTILIFDIAFSPDGTKLAATMQESEGIPNLFIWDVATGTEIKRLGGGGVGHLGTTLGAVFTPDGSQIISVSEDGDSARNALVWDVETGEIVARMPHETGLVGLALSADGKYVATGSISDGTLLMWETTNWTKVREFIGHEVGVFGLSFSADGKWLASGGVDNSAIVWDVESAKPIHRFADLPSFVRSVDFDPEAKLLAGAFFLTGDVQIWDLTTGSPIHLLETHTGFVNSVDFDPDGRRLVSGGASGGIVWAMDEYAAEIQRTELNQNISAFALNAEQDLALASLESGKIQLYRVATGELIQEFENTEAATALVFSTDGERAIAGTQNGEVKIWDIQTGELLQTLTGHRAPVRAIALSPDGKYIASGGGNINITANRPLDNDIILWDAETGAELRRMSEHSAPVRAIVFTPNSLQILSGGDDFDLILSSVDSSVLPIYTLEGHTDSILSLAISADGKYALSGSRDNNLVYWDLQTRENLATLRGHTTPVQSISFHPSGNYALSGGGFGLTQNRPFDNSLILWDLNLGEEIRRFSGHSDPIKQVSFGETGQQALSASQDGLLIQWRIDEADEFLDWVYNNYEIPCYPASELGPNPRCAVVDDPASEEEIDPATIAEVEQDASTEASEVACVIPNPNPLPASTIDTSAFARTGSVTLGFSNASSSDGYDLLIGAWVLAEGSQQEQVSEVVAKNAEGNLNQQIADIEALIEQGVDALIVNPVEVVDNGPLEAALQKAQEAGIPVVLVNRRVPNTSVYTSFVGADDFKVGCVMMQEIVAMMDGEGNLARLNGTSSTPSDTARESGAFGVLSLYPGITDINAQATNLDPDIAQNFMLGYINSSVQVGNQKRTLPIEGIYAFNGMLSLAAYETLQAQNQPLLPVVGDGYVGLAKFALANDLPSAQVRIPNSMGADAVNVALKILAGEEVSSFVEIPLEIITSAELSNYDLSRPDNTMLGDYEGLPEAFVPVTSE